MNNEELNILKELLNTHTHYINEKTDALFKKMDNVLGQIANNKKDLEEKIQKVDRKTKWSKLFSFIGGIIGGFVAVITQKYWG